MELLAEWVMWNLVPVHLETMLVSVQYRCIVEMNVPQAQKSIWTNPMVLLGDEAQVEACFSLFGDSAIINAILVHYLRQTYNRLRKHFDHTR
jgi:hypothetical protein